MRVHPFGVLSCVLIASASWALQPAAQPSPAPASVSSGVGSWQTIAQGVESRASAEYAKHPVGALSVALIADDKIVWTGHYGNVSGPGSELPTGSTLYRIGSITKTFTALALLKLESEDRCAFSDPIGKYFPHFSEVPNQPPSGAQPTLIQLATHTSGLAREPEDGDEFDIGPVAQWENVLVRMIPKIRFQAEPGSAFGYSNVGYALLGSAIGKAAGTPYITYVTEQILNPLGMNDTMFDLPDSARSRVAIGHDVQDGVASTDVPERELAGRGFRVPNGALFSSLDDLARWTRFQMGDPSQSVFDPAALKAAQGRFIIAGPRLGSGYGIGIQVKRIGKATVMGHNGGTPGYRADFLFDPETKIGIVMLRSALGDDFDSDAILSKAFPED